MNDSYKIVFFQFLNQELSIKDFENYIYNHLELEEKLGEEIYLELVGWDFQDKNTRRVLEDLIYNNILTEGEFETWRLKKLLTQFIKSSEDLDKKLNLFYDLYCNAFDRVGEILNGYKFLGHLAFNYLYWMEEGYLKTNYDADWKSEYEKCKNDFDFYHQQLQPIAQMILDGFERNEIEIIKIGDYKISATLKSKLESDHFFQLQHKNK